MYSKERCSARHVLQALQLATDIKTAFGLHPTRGLDKKHLSNGGSQVSVVWVSKLAHSASVGLLHWK